MLSDFRLLGMTDNQHRRILELRSSFCLSVIDGQNEKDDHRDEGPTLVHTPPRERNLHGRQMDAVKQSCGFTDARWRDALRCHFTGSWHCAAEPAVRFGLA